MRLSPPQHHRLAVAAGQLVHLERRLDAWQDAARREQLRERHACVGHLEDSLRVEDRRGHVVGRALGLGSGSGSAWAMDVACGRGGTPRLGSGSGSAWAMDVACGRGGTPWLGSGSGSACAMDGRGRPPRLRTRPWVRVWVWIYIEQALPVRAAMLLRGLDPNSTEARVDGRGRLIASGDALARLPDVLDDLLKIFLGLGRQPVAARSRAGTLAVVGCHRRWLGCVLGAGS